MTRNDACTVRSPLAGVMLVVAAFAWLATAGVAGAHGDEGEMAVTSAVASGASVRIEVGLTYANDGDLAVDATVSAVLTGPGGATVGPVDLARVGDGAVYAAEVEVPEPGSWSVEVTSTGPAATATAAVDVAAPTTTTEPAPETTEAPEPTDAPSTTIPDHDDPADEGTESDDDGDGLVIALVVGAAIVVLLAGFAGWRLSRRDQQPPPT